MRKLAKESLLKDRGSSYRYTQAFKLQLEILQKLAYVISDLDMAIEHIDHAMEAAFLYLDVKQPVPLQVILDPKTRCTSEHELRMICFVEAGMVIYKSCVCHK